MKSRLISLDRVDCFRRVLDVPAETITPELLEAVRDLDEREELEPFVRAILTDTGDTPHGPAELADILTHKVSVSGEPLFAAFVLKGRSFKTVRPSHVSHQIYRLEKIAGLEFTVFGATGTVLDQAKEEFISTAKRLGCYYGILDAHDLARLFVAYGFLCPRDASRIVGGRCRCGYSPRHREFNVLQAESLKELERAHALGQRAGLIVLPTGSGKTRIAAADAQRSSAKRVLYVAHTHEILDVAEEEFGSVFGRTNVQRATMSKELQDSRPVTLTTIQFLQGHHAAVSSAGFDYVIVDEFHHAAARSYRELIDAIGDAFLLGLTATPFRGDRQSILDLCHGNVLVNFELRSGIDSGILAPYHYFGCFDDVDYGSIKHKGATYGMRDLEKALIVPARDRAIIGKWREHAPDKPTIAFCCSHKHADRVAESFRKEGTPAEPYLSTTDRNTRTRLMRRFQRGMIKVLCVVDVLNEGADIPFVECLLFLRPTESKRIFFQQLGRGLRKFVGKPYCTVIDFIGNFRNAYRIVEYQGLLPFADEQASAGGTRTPKETLNLPEGCAVHFEERVIDVFVRQTFDPRYATRHNIGRILLYQYDRLQRSLGHYPSRSEVDQRLLLHSGFYRDVFGSWREFEVLVRKGQG